MKQRWQLLCDRFEQLSRRDRMTAFCGALAVIAGMEMLWVQPMHDKRMIIMQSTQAERAAVLASDAAGRAERAERLADMSRRLASMESRLTALGMKEVHREELSAFLDRTALSHGVALVGVRALPLETLALTPESSASVNAAPPEVLPPLYRHRAELKLQGPLHGLTLAMDTIEREAMPLRIERVVVAPLATGALQAKIILTAISQERTWLAL